MFFFGLLIYLVIFPFAYWLFSSFVSTPGILLTLFWTTALYALSVSLGILWAFLIDVYNPSAKERMRNLLRVIGVRWLCALTVIVILGFVLLAIFEFDTLPNKIVVGVLIPTLFVSGLNAVGFEFPLKRLEEVPQPGKVILPEVPPPPEVKEEIVKNFHWTFEGKDYSLTLVIRRSVYDFFRNQARILDYSKWSEEYVIEGITGEIRELAHQLYKAGMPYGTYQEVSFVLSCVQQVIQYQKEEGEYPRYPVETLADGVGDCEDFSILGAAILKSMGYEVALLFLPQHAALGVAGAEGLPGSYVEHNGIHYYYCEMTAGGWKLGEIPEKYETAKVKVSPVPALPVKVVRPEQSSMPA